MDEITGTIQTVKGPFNETWYIMTLQTGETVTGCKPASVKIGDHCKFAGAYKEHNRYGRHFAATEITVAFPKDHAGIVEYLKQHIPGIGQKTSRKIVEYFGPDLFDILDNSPEKLAEIRGISSAKAQTIADKYQEIKNRQDEDVFYTTNGITLNLRARLVKVFKTDQKVIQVLKKNPYIAIDYVDGFGFQTADKIARSIDNLSLDNEIRVNAGIVHTLRTAEKSGHCFLPMRKMLAEAGRLLSVSPDTVREKLNKDKFILESGRIYNIDLYEAEKAAARRLIEILSYPDKLVISNISFCDYDLLSPDQQQAFDFAVSQKVSIITGSPGTGKTHLLSIILRAFGELNVELAAPTGKAAKRMKQSTNQSAMTIHRLLKYSPGDNKFYMNEDYPLKCDAVIIDEASMVDIRLLAALLKALPDRSRIIFIGDADQLPSVGPGRVLADLISAGIPTAKLTTLHRQAAHSLIAVNAQQINNGQDIISSSDIESDFIFHEEEDTEKIVEAIIKLCQYFIDDNPQVLCPQRKGSIGANELNPKLRDEVFNPEGRAVPGTIFRKGDRVIQMRNNYNLEIFNGDIGTIAEYDHNTLYIRFDEGIIDYPKSNIPDLALAYALTIHKSQGSEFGTVIIPMHEANYMMLKRQLFYTGVTRGKSRVIVIGTESAIAQAIENPDMSRRYSALEERL